MKINDVKKVIHAAYLANDTVLIQGQHGIGKSEIVRQFAEEQNMNFVDLRLSNNEVGDLIGIPHIVENGNSKVTTWAIPSWLQRIHESAQNGQHSLLFLDELNRAPLDVRQCGMQLVLDGQIHEHVLPIVNGRKTMIVAAINPADEYQVEELDPALLDRFLFVDAEVDAQTWLKWAKDSQKNQIVRDFIAEYPSRLHYTPAEGIGCTPRSWAKLSDFIDNANDIPNEILFQIIKGKVGSEVGSQFYTFFTNYVDVVKIEDIEKIVADNKDDVENIDELALIIAERIEATEAIQQSELAHSLAEKYMSKKDILPFLCYLYALRPEILIGFLKGYRKDKPNKYKKLAEIDTELNNKELFKRVVRAAEKE